jgi:hypothetical protein
MAGMALQDYRTKAKQELGKIGVPKRESLGTRGKGFKVPLWKRGI